MLTKLCIDRLPFWDVIETDVWAQSRYQVDFDIRDIINIKFERKLTFSDLTQLSCQQVDNDINNAD